MKAIHRETGEPVTINWYRPPRLGISFENEDRHETVFTRELEFPEGLPEPDYSRPDIREMDSDEAKRVVRERRKGKKLHTSQFETQKTRDDSSTSQN